MIAIRKPDGSVVRNKNEIVKVVAEFYRYLYSSVDSEPDKPQTSECTDDIPDILPAEVDKAVTQMKKGKSPDDDGISIDILKVGGKEIAETLALLFTKCLQQIKVPDSWNNAVVGYY